MLYRLAARLFHRRMSPSVTLECSGSTELWHFRGAIFFGPTDAEDLPRKFQSGVKPPHSKFTNGIASAHVALLSTPDLNLNVFWVYLYSR